MRYFLKVRYEGSNYAGWQFQPNQKTVQGEINEALEKILGHPIASMGCGRTDSGVHARNQYMHFETGHGITKNFLQHLNTLLPDDISALQLMVSNSENGHARFSAQWRKYRYYIHFRKDPLLRHTSLRLRFQPCREGLQACTALLQGRHDFGAFGIKKDRSKTTICTVHEASWHFEEEQWYFEIQADRFLRGMVRMLVGSMLRISRPGEGIEEFERYLNYPGEGMARPSAEPQGLTFWDAGYPEGFFAEAVSMP
jgi:tRNA pseudouridine38-40 synthase